MDFLPPCAPNLVFERGTYIAFSIVIEDDSVSHTSDIRATTL